MNLLLFFLVAVLCGCAASSYSERTEIKELQKGRKREDTSYLYSLPYEKGSSHRIIQGYYGPFSHKNRIALDFRMKQGTKITAVRDGVVIRMREDSNKGGWSRKNRKHANFVVIGHSDGTRAGYWHLQQNGVLVDVGDSIKQGQVIGLSGKTGYSAMPHLHFIVWSNQNGEWQQLPTRFLTAKGPKYLRPFRRYKSK